MELFYLVIGFPLFILIVSIVAVIKNAGKAESREQALQYFKTADKLHSSSFGKSIKSVKNGIEKLDIAYIQAGGISNDIISSVYQEDRTYLVDELHDLEQAKWEKKADKYLQDFLDCYNLIIEGDLENFRDVELLFKTKKRCIDQWQKYYGIDLSEYETTIYPKRYFREWMGEDYDPCMESHDALEKKLSECVDSMRPEHRRKKALYEILVDYVRRQGTVARGDLLKKSFDGYIEEEVKCCYRALIKDNRLIEVKLGDRYFVSLSDKEAQKSPREIKTAKPAKNQEPEKVSEPKKTCNIDKEKEQEMVIKRETLIHDMIVQHLKDKKVEFIDKTDKGGGLYFFDEATAKEIQAEGYKVQYAKSGAKSTSGRPAWYVRIE